MRNKLTDNRINVSAKPANDRETGSAIIIALFVMLLLLGFVALAVTRTTNETIASSNDEAETRAFEAAQASLEVVTRNFDKIFEQKLNPDQADIDRVKSQTPPNFAAFTFTQDIDQTQNTVQVTMTGQELQGLNALRDKWEINTVAKDANGVQVLLRRDFYNNRVPVFQFGVFYDDDLEFHPGPRFDFGGRVHTNGNLFLMAGEGLYFSSKVTTASEVFTDVARSGAPASNWGDPVFIKNASGNYVQLREGMGSVLKNPIVGTPVFASNPDMPTVYKNLSWQSNQNLFQGNLLTQQPSLDLPIRLYHNMSSTPLDYVEIIKRGKNIGDLYNNGSGTVAAPNLSPVTVTSADGAITAAERYYNKTGIRISLADSKAKLPGCASGSGTGAVTTACGVCLNGKKDGSSGAAETDGSRGYEPRPMTGTPTYQATRINGNRLYAGKEIWIKVEVVGVNPATNVWAAPRDITQDFLSLGLTQQAPNLTGQFQITSPTTYYTNGIDSRSIVKLQRFAMAGAANASSDTAYMTSYTWSGNTYNVVLTDDCTVVTYNSGCSTSVDNGDFGSFSDDNPAHRKAAIVDNATRFRRVAPFPINMFDTREGLYHEGNSVFNPNSTYGSNVPWAGVMSIVDIDVANLRSFLFSGTWDGKFPAGTPFATAAGHTLTKADVPSANGWVLYVSDRRGDYDFDGEYDMEDIYGNNDDILQPGEDINDNGTLQRDYTNEAPKYTRDGLYTTSAPNSYVLPDIAAAFEHKFYRRGVRLINGETLPGIFTNPIDTKGFTFASENGVYVQGNYNASSINSVGTPTSPTDYNPQGTLNHIPASIAADAITILSGNWSDARSFRYPFSLNSRPATETFIRFAMIAGDTRSSRLGDPNQGGGDPRMSGGVHNFLRFLEDWDDERLNYSGSMINLFNSHNNNGAFKCCDMVYSPPTRNWVFDASFLDPNRLPPGTPFFQTIQMSGFQRIN
jgi:Tfp pilus assembly protein PilX